MMVVWVEVVVVVVVETVVLMIVVWVEVVVVVVVEMVALMTVVLMVMVMVMMVVLVVEVIVVEMVVEKVVVLVKAVCTVQQEGEGFVHFLPSPLSLCCTHPALQQQLQFTGESHCHLWVTLSKTSAHPLGITSGHPPQTTPQQARFGGGKDTQLYPTAGDCVVEYGLPR